MLIRGRQFLEQAANIRAFRKRLKIYVEGNDIADPVTTFEKLYDILPPPPAVIEVKDLDDLISSWEGEIDYVHVPVKTSPVKAHEPFAPRHMQYAVEIVKPRVFDPPMKIKIVKAILAKQTPPK